MPPPLFTVNAMLKYENCTRLHTNCKLLIGTCSGDSVKQNMLIIQLTYLQIQSVLLISLLLYWLDDVTDIQEEIETLRSANNLVYVSGLFQTFAMCELPDILYIYISYAIDFIQRIFIASFRRLELVTSQSLLFVCLITLEILDGFSFNFSRMFVTVILRFELVMKSIGNLISK